MEKPMTTAVDLLKAPRFGIKDFKTHLSERIKSKKTMVLMDHGEPKKVVIDYDELVNMVEIIEELQDEELLKLVREGRAAIERGEPGIDVEASFKKIRAQRKRWCIRLSIRPEPAKSKRSDFWPN